MYEQMQDNYEVVGIDEPSYRQLKRKADRNLERALAFEEAMFNWRSRHLILILTLTYKDEYRNIVTLNDLQRDRDTLFNNMRMNSFLRKINGYIWKIEEGGEGGGLHMHVVIFYDRADHADIYIAKGIGDYWSEILTSKRGDYWNSNADKEKYRYVATGQIDRHDIVKRSALRSVLEYMAKTDQHVSSRTNPHCRMFGTSQVPT